MKIAYKTYAPLKKWVGKRGLEDWNEGDLKRHLAVVMSWECEKKKKKPSGKEKELNSKRKKSLEKRIDVWQIKGKKSNQGQEKIFKKIMKS